MWAQEAEAVLKIGRVGRQRECKNELWKFVCWGQQGTAAKASSQRGGSRESERDLGSIG